MFAGIARRYFVPLLGVAAILSVTPVWAAQSPGGGPAMKRGFESRQPPFERAFRFHGRFWDNPKIAAALKITPDQQKEMDDILFQHREKLIDLQAGLKRAELEMEPLMNADEPNRTSIESQIDKVVAARGALERANADFLLDIRMKLTPDQWKEIKNFRAEGGMRGMHREWGPGGPGARMRMRGPNAPSGGPAPQTPPPAQNPPPDAGAAPPSQ